MVETLKIHVAAVHDDIRTGLRNDLIQGLDIMNFAVGDIDEYRNGALDIDHRVQLHCSFGAPKSRPRKQSKHRSIVVESNA